MSDFLCYYNINKKASGADTRTKVDVIRSNAHKYSISALCKCLEIARSTYYYETIEPLDEKKLENDIVEIFNTNRKVYGSRKIKVELLKKGKQVSQRRICRRACPFGYYEAT